MTRVPKPVMLVILDGWGWREAREDNAVRLANTPTFDRLWSGCPHALLHTSGGNVGLPDGQMGNSEVGHLNIGAGRVVLQELVRIGRACADGSIARNPALLGLIEALKTSGGTCNLMGLVSPGGVHSHEDHALALARALAEAGVKVAFHAFTDGRDTPPRSGADDVRRLQAALPSGVTIATVSGRYYAMDRDHRWDRVQKAYAVMVEGEGPRFPDAVSVVEAGYAADVTDEFIVPACVGDWAGMKDGDAVLCFNFRADRVRQILGALLDPGFDGFTRKRVVRFAAAVGMASYSEELDKRLATLFPPERLTNVLGDLVSKAGLHQLRMAETEKYPHVTYFLNGGEETPYPGEDRILVPSPKVATYDLQPEMSAHPLADRAVEAIESGRYDLIVLNFANPDMVGHTGSLPAAIKAVETVDHELGRIEQAIAKQGGALLIIADHGNCELMRDPVTGGPHTAHTTNPVPMIYVSEEASHYRLRTDGALRDISPTLLNLLKLGLPKEMTGGDMRVPIVH